MYFLQSNMSFFEQKLNVMLKLRIVGAFWNLDFCRINFHVWLSSTNFAGIEFHNFAEKTQNREIFHQQKCVALK